MRQGADDFSVALYTQLDGTLGREAEPNGTSDQPDHLKIVEVLRDDTFTVLFQKNAIHNDVVTRPEDGSQTRPESSRTRRTNSISEDMRRIAQFCLLLSD